MEGVMPKKAFITYASLVPVGFAILAYGLYAISWYATTGLWSTEPKPIDGPFLLAAILAVMGLVVVLAAPETLIATLLAVWWGLNISESFRAEVPLPQDGLALTSVLFFMPGALICTLGAGILYLCSVMFYLGWKERHEAIA